MLRPRNSAWQAGAPLFGAENGTNERIRSGYLMLFEISWEIQKPKTWRNWPASDASAFLHAYFPVAAKILGARRVSSSFPCGKVKLKLPLLPLHYPRHVPTCTDVPGVERSWRQRVGFKIFRGWTKSFRPLRWLPHLREAEPLKSAKQKFKKVPIHLLLISWQKYSLFVYICKRHCVKTTSFLRLFAHHFFDSVPTDSSQRGDIGGVDALHQVPDLG